MSSRPDILARMSSHLQISTAVSTRDEADRIAAALVERRLAGCVQIVGPVQSVYRWQGALERAEEWLCVVKTRSEQFGAVASAIRELHSYECPEIIATAIVAGSADYLAWLAAQTRPDQPSVN
jgi:periplasmic divalent cation tolerance protein